MIGDGIMKKILVILILFLFSVSCSDDKKGTENDTVNDSDNLEVNDSETDQTEVDYGTDDVADTEKEDDVEEDMTEEETDDDIEQITKLEIKAGEGIGDIKVGMKYSEIKTLVGEVDTQMGFNRLVTAEYKSLGLELVFSSPDLMELKDDAILISIGAMEDGSFSGNVVPGMSRSDIEDILTGDKEDTGDYVFYPAGISVHYEDDEAVLVGVFPAYELQYDPPEMKPCSTTIN